MRTSLNEIKRIEEHILGHEDPAEALLFDAMLLLDPSFAEQVSLQKRVHAVVLQYSRKKLKVEINSVHEQLFSRREHLSFRRRILNLFNKH
jgi:hypothetical protein